MTFQKFSQNPFTAGGIIPILDEEAEALRVVALGITRITVESVLIQV